jgi:outer membrane protein assembly factor BamB
MPAQWSDSRTITIICTLFHVLLAQGSISAQDWALSNIQNLQRVDIRELGYPQINEVPENSSAITSLLTASSGKIYGGTTGENAYMFLFDPATNKAHHLGKLGDQRTIHHALVEDKNGFIYIGTGGVNMYESIELSDGGTGEYEKDRFINPSLWEDIKRHFAGVPGGHLYRYDPNASERAAPVQGIFAADYSVKFVGDECNAVDLGMPLQNNMIYAMTISPKGDEIYMLTYPDGHFIVYDIDEQKFEDKGEIDKEVVFHGPERHWRSLPRALVCDDSGRVFTSGTGGAIVYYDPAIDNIVTTSLTIPGEQYPIHRTSDFPVVEYFTRDNKGLIYGGTSDGYLFSLDPATLKLVNLGKARSAKRLRALSVAKNGKVYFIAGERPETSPNPCQFYSYDPETGGFETLGLLVVDRSPHYYWRGYQFDSMTLGLDGTIYLGESERRSHLFLYIP